VPGLECDSIIGFSAMDAHQTDRIRCDPEGVHDQMYVFERDIIIARSTTLVYYRSMWTGLYKPKVKLPSYMISSIVTMK
jgi:hypothetical protein